MKSVLSKFRNGFTLVELLVVMAILGILATITLANFSSSQRKGRDAQRKSDLRQIANAVEAYNNDHGSYPQSTTDGEIIACGCTEPVGTCEWDGSREMCDGNSTVYIKEIPDDVKASTSWPHYYYWSDGRSYKLYANFENTNDVDCLVKTGDSCSPIASYGGVDYVYGVSSPNTTPIDLQLIQELPAEPTLPPSEPTLPPSEPEDLPIPTESCFLAGTDVTIIDHDSYLAKPIEEITSEDKVLSYNLISKTFNSAKVLRVYVSEANSYYRVSTKEAKVEVTADHPFLTSRGVFQKVKNLEVGDKVYLSCSQSLCEQTITEKELINNRVRVYNLSVDGDHVYFANGFLVHNKIVIQ